MLSQYKLLQKAWQFYRSAKRDIVDEETAKEEYQTFIKHFVVSASLNEVLDWIDAYQDKPYFKIQDFLDPTAQWLLRHYIHGLQQAFLKYHIKPELIKQIINYRAELFLLEWKNSRFIESINIYRAIENVKNLIDPALMEKAKRQMILRLIKQFVKAQQTGKMETLMDGWQALYASSTELPHEFLEELAKKFGIDFYVDAVEQSRSNKMTLQKFLNKNKDDITIYDIALLFNYVWLSDKDFKFVLNKIQHNPELRTFVRGYVYSSSSGYFMLDESLKPMNADYQTISLPFQISPIHLRNVTKNYYDKWQQLFDEFHLIPS